MISRYRKSFFLFIHQPGDFEHGSNRLKQAGDVTHVATYWHAVSPRVFTLGDLGDLETYVLLGGAIPVISGIYITIVVGAPYPNLRKFESHGCTNPPTPAFAKAGAAPGTTAGVELVFLSFKCFNASRQLRSDQPAVCLRSPL